MALHRLTSITMGVPNVEETCAYYAEFGLAAAAASDGSPGGETWFSTRDAGRQLRVTHAPTRRLVDLHVGVDDEDDLARAADSLRRMDIEVERGAGWISAAEPRSHLPRHGERCQVTPVPSSAAPVLSSTVPSGPKRWVISAHSASAPATLQATSSQMWTTAPGEGPVVGGAVRNMA